MLNLLSDYGLCFCDGEYDECGVCNGSGPSIPIIESIEILYDSVYAEPIDEWFVLKSVQTLLFSRLLVIEGCTNENAFNFDNAANSDNGPAFSTGIADYHLHMTAKNMQRLKSQMLVGCRNLNTAIFLNGIQSQLDSEGLGIYV